MLSENKIITIEARWVAAGIGEPSIWLGTDDRWWKDGDTHERGAWHRLGVRLDDPQTAFGVALRLDAWERAADPDAEENSWREWLASWTGLPRYEELLHRMARRATTIGMHASVARTHLHCEPEPGQLLTLRYTVECGWTVNGVDVAGADHTDNVEIALRALAEGTP